MRRLFAAALLLLLLGAAAAMAESSPSPSPAPDFAPAVVVSANGLEVNLREAPSTQARSIAQYAPGTRVACAFEEGATWLAVRANGVTGFMMAAYVEPVRPEETAPPLSLGIDAYRGEGYTLSATLTERAGIWTAHADLLYDAESEARLTGVSLLLDGQEIALLPYCASDDPSEAAFHVAFYRGDGAGEALLLTSDGAQIAFDSP